MKDKLIAEERMLNLKEMFCVDWYDYVVINDDINQCFNKINNLINAEVNNGSKIMI